MSNQFIPNPNLVDHAISDADTEQTDPEMPHMIPLDAQSSTPLPQSMLRYNNPATLRLQERFPKPQRTDSSNHPKNPPHKNNTWISGKDAFQTFTVQP